MESRVLFVATYGDFMATFEYDNIKIWQSMGVEVHCAADFEDKRYNLYTERLHALGVKCHQIAFSRSPLSISNLAVYKQLKSIIKENQINIIDCHNPVASIYARIAAWRLGIKRVIYTVHGFFFYKGCPLKNRILFQPVETFFAAFTDALIVINQEDYAAAQKMPVRGKAYHIPGVGIDVEGISKRTVLLDLRKELKIDEKAYLIGSVGELNANKNHEVVLRAMQMLFKEEPEADIHYCICGQGNLESYLRKKTEEYNLQGKVHLLGYRTDIPAVDRNINLFVMPSLREGLGVALMEAMIAGKPALVTSHGGPKDLIEEGLGGYLFEPSDAEQLKELMKKMYHHPELEERFGRYNQEAVKKCDISNVHKIMSNIYHSILGTY